MNAHHPDPEPPGADRSDATGRRSLVRLLIHRAARSAPAPLSERLEEEWLADLATRTSPISRLRFALGCCWATRVIAGEQCIVAVAVPTAGATSAWAQSDRELGLWTRHSVTVISVIAFHLLIVGVLVLGLGGRIKHVRPPHLEVHELTDVAPRPPTLVLPKLEKMRAALTLPLPELPPSLDNDDQRRISAPPTEVAPASAGLPQAEDATASAHGATRVPGGPGAGFPNTDDFYPTVSRFREEQGVAMVQVCVDPAGRLTAEPAMLESSGFARLDAGALRLAKAGSGHYRASTEDGSPVNSCYAFRVHFQLHN